MRSMKFTVKSMKALKYLTPGDAYLAYVDASGRLRVRDNSGGYNTYSHRNFEVVTDPTGAFENAFGVKGSGKMEAVKVKKDAPPKEPKTLGEFLLSQGVPRELLAKVVEWRKKYNNDGLSEDVKARIPQLSLKELFRGKDLWIESIASVLAGHNILYSGEKATGKNTLIYSLAYLFQRPLWEVSFHNNTTADEIVGSETFKNGEVVFNPGMFYLAAIHGGFVVGDEINMAKDNAIAVLNAITDNRRIIDVPGYDRVKLHPATRIFGTMNYGYAGTRPLNEALASRFTIPTIKTLDLKGLTALLKAKFPELKVEEGAEMFANLFERINERARNAEISSASVDLRGIISAIELIKEGITVHSALEMTVVNKSFETYEQDIVRDIIRLCIPAATTRDDIFL